VIYTTTSVTNLRAAEEHLEHSEFRSATSAVAQSVGVPFPAWEINFSLLHSVQNASPIQWVPGAEIPGREAEGQI
jgi:hypothetical protein